MFSTLFHYPRVLARHRNGPSADDRERYLAHCAEGGAAHSTLLSLAPELLAISRRIVLDSGRLILPAEVEMAADRWVRYQRRHQRIVTGRFSRERFIQTATVKYLNNVIEQDHRAIKRRTRPMLGFKDFHCARVILSGIDVMHMVQK
jgi:integrase/recombinase XerD